MSEETLKNGTLYLWRGIVACFIGYSLHMGRQMTKLEGENFELQKRLIRLEAQLEACENKVLQKDR